MKPKVLKYNQFINEDVTSNLVQQKNSLTQQINDLQKKLLDVNQQIITAQKQTLSQNPQTQLPVQENHHSGHDITTIEPKPIPHGAKLITTEFFPPSHGKSGDIYVHYVHNNEEIEEEFPSPDFEEHIQDESKEFDSEDVKRFYAEDSDGEGTQHYFDPYAFWKDLDKTMQREMILNYLRKKKLMH